MAKYRIKLPKHVAGVKIPKAIRKGPIMDFANSSAGQLLLVEALVAAVGLFAIKRINDEGTGDVLSHPLESLQRAGRSVGGRASDAQAAMARNTARLQFALTEAVRAFRSALAEPSEVPAINEPASTVAPEGDGGKKKSRSAGEPSAPH